ncbi:MAG: cation:proton antiporter [Nitrososphaerales archaeon]
MTTGFAVLAALIVLYAALAVKLGRWSITMPMVFVLVGAVLGAGGMGLLPISPKTEPVKALTEVTLALLLFADASTLRLQEVQSDAGLPARLLTIGLVLTIVCGAGVAFILLPQEGLAFACLLGAILAPTDAALGLPIFNNPRVPVRIRRALNIESGLNDGIATPFVLLFLAFATATTGESSGDWLSSALIEIGLALVAAVVAGVMGGWLLSQAARRGWTGGVMERLAILGLALAAYFGSLAIGGNGFIAAFAGGIVFRAATRGQLVEPTEFTETLGSFLSLLVWGIFGAVLVIQVLRTTADWRPVLYAILSLTAVRMLSVALALRGTGLRRDTVALMGWFGPRGLASVVFTLIALESFSEVSRPIDALIAAATWTILLSVFAHGLSATPLSIWYARRLEAAAEPPVELEDAPELRQRRRVLAGPPH